IDQVTPCTVNLLTVQPLPFSQIFIIKLVKECRRSSPVIPCIGRQAISLSMSIMQYFVEKQVAPCPYRIERNRKDRFFVLRTIIWHELYKVVSQLVLIGVNHSVCMRDYIIPVRCTDINLSIKIQFSQ